MSYFEQSAVAPPARRIPRLPLLALFLILGAVVGILASQVTFWLLGQGAGSAETVAAYHAGDGEAFHAREAKFAADFPTSPDREVVKIPVGDIKLSMTQFVSQPTPDSAVGVAFYQLPTGVPFDVAGGIRGAAAGMNTEIVTKSKTRHQGYPAMTALTRSSIGVETRMMVVVKGTRAYFLMAVGSEDPETSFRTLVDSFKMD